MSSGIMERNLPVATELGEGDMVRIVTGGGNSKQIDKNVFGCRAFVATIEVIGDVENGQFVATSKSIDKTRNELFDAINSGMIPVFVVKYHRPSESPVPWDIQFVLSTSQPSNYIATQKFEYNVDYYMQIIILPNDLNIILQAK